MKESEIKEENQRKHELKEQKLKEQKSGKNEQKLKRGKMVLTALGLALLCLLVAVGCDYIGEKGEQQGKDQSGKKQETASVTLNEVAHSVFYAPMYVAIEEGYFAKEGIDLKLVTGFGADKTMTAVLTGEADIGFMGCESTLYTYAEGVSDYVVNFAQLTQRAGNFLVARNPMENFKWSDLKGKTILGGRAGGMPEMVFEYILRMNGLDPKTDMSIDQSVDFGATAAAFSGSDVDFTVEFEPHATLLEQKGDGYIVASLGEASGYVPYTSFCVKKSYLEQNKEMLLGFTKALQKGMDYVNSHSAKEVAACISKQFPEMEVQTLETIIDRYGKQDTWKKDLVFEQDSFDLLQNILMDSEVLEERVPYEDLVNTELAKEAAVPLPLSPGK